MSNTELSTELATFFSHYIAEAPGSEPEDDLKAAQNFMAAAPAERVLIVSQQLESLAQAQEISLEALGAEANRWFADKAEAQDWLGRLVTVFKSGSSASATSIQVKDSNGTALSEGDSVQVIKDLKVKGGSSDLKRGTLIKKIHLIGDPDNIECRVDGSTLVLKTCFLKKA